MSIKNRKKLFEGLARISVLGFFSFQRLYPKAINASITADDNCSVVIGSKRFDVEKGKPLSINATILSGSEIRAEKKQATVTETHTEEQTTTTNDEQDFEYAGTQDPPEAPDGYTWVYYGEIVESENGYTYTYETYILEDGNGYSSGFFDKLISWDFGAPNPRSSGYWNVTITTTETVEVTTTKKVYKPLKVSFVFSFDSPSQSMTVNGADGTDKQAFIRFLVPLPSPFAYSEPIQSAFGLDTSTRGVSSYPDCR